MTAMGTFIIFFVLSNNGSKIFMGEVKNAKLRSFVFFLDFKRPQVINSRIKVRVWILGLFWVLDLEI